MNGKSTVRAWLIAGWLGFVLYRYFNYLLRDLSLQRLLQAAGGILGQLKALCCC